MHRSLVSMILVILFLALPTAPAASGEEKKQKDNYIDRQRIGAGFLLSGEKIGIHTVDPNLPAGKAGVKPGDVIVTADGKRFTSASSLYNYIGTRKKDAKISLVVERGGKTLAFTVGTITSRMRPTMIKLANMLMDNQKVALAVVVSDVKSTVEMKPEVASSWAAGVRSEVQTGLENFYLKYGGSYPNFSIVDRSRTEALLEEFKLAQTGLVSENLRLKIGEMTGATHLLDVTFMRYKGAKGHSDVKNLRLIDISSGTVLAVDQTRTTTEKK